MQTRNTLEHDSAAAMVFPEGAPSLSSRMSWGAVIAGTVVALTIGLMLNALGTGLGATTIDATARATPSASSFGIGAALWLLVSNLIGLGVGGYVAARLSGTADNTDGMLHGLAMWGATFLVSAMLVGNLVSGIASTATSGVSSLLGSAASGVGSAASAVGQQVADRTSTSTMQFKMQGIADRIQGVLNGNGGNPATMTSDQRRADMGRLVTRRITDGELSQSDRDRLNQLVAAEYDISPEEARTRVTQAEQQAQQAARQAEETARRAADAAASGTLIAASSIFGIMLLGGLAAVFGARRGTRDLLLARGSRING